MLDNEWPHMIFSNARAYLQPSRGYRNCARGRFFICGISSPGRKVPTAWHLICAGSISAILVPS